MRGLKIIIVGKIRTGFHREAFNFYLKKIKKYTSVELLVARDVKDESISLRLEKEAELILGKISSRDLVIVLDEKGKSFNSRDFSSWLDKWQEDPGRIPCFIIGGAYGLSEKIKSRADLLMGLGPITLPHELAGVILVEQIYRGYTILKGHPYHH
jgi:23S rRNA (pseudouridine1915-N3)-methyltransferase